MAEPDSSSPRAALSLPPTLLAAWLAARAAALSWLFFGALHRFYFFSGDYPSRVLMAWEWLRHPSWFLGGGIWLPASFYATGLALKLWPDPLAAPAALHILMSTATLALVYAVTRELFPEKPWAGVWAALCLSYDPLLTALSVSGGASEIDAQLWLLAGAWAWLVFERTRRRGALFAAAALLGAAGFTRHEMWCFLAGPSLLLLSRLRRDPRAGAPALALMWLPAGAWIASRAEGGLFLLMSPAGILGNLRGGVPLANGGSAPWTALLWAYPGALVLGHPLLLALAAAGAALAYKTASRRRASVWLAWTALALAGFCLTPIFSIVFAPAHERVAFVFLPLLAPFMGLALASAARRPPAAAALAAAALALSWTSFSRSRARLSTAMPIDPEVRSLAVDVARLRPQLGPRRRLLVERAAHAPSSDPNAIWDYVVFQYAAAPFWVLDRPDRPVVHRADGGYELPAGSPPSALALGSEDLARFLREEDVAFAIVRSSEAVARLEPGMRVLRKAGPLTLLGRPL